MEFNFFTFIFLFAILTSVIALLWLNFRQDKAISNSYDTVPEGFNETIELKAPESRQLHQSQVKTQSF